MAEYIAIMMVLIENKTTRPVLVSRRLNLKEVTELDYYPRTSTAQITSDLEECKRLIVFIQEYISYTFLLVNRSDYCN